MLFLCSVPLGQVLYELAHHQAPVVLRVFQTMPTRASLRHRGLPAPFERDPASAVEGRIGVPKLEDEID